MRTPTWRSARQIGSTPNWSRKASMNPPPGLPVAELGREKSTRRAQNRVHPAKLSILPLQRPDRAASAKASPAASPGRSAPAGPAARRVRLDPPAAAHLPAGGRHAGVLVPTRSSTSRTARSHSSSGYFRVAPIVPLSRGLGASTKPGAIHLTRHSATIAELTSFRTAALSRIAAQHDEITRLRRETAPASIRLLPATAQRRQHPETP